MTSGYLIAFGLAVATTATPESAPGRFDEDFVSVTVENPIDATRRDEVVTVPWSVLLDRLPALTPDRVRVVESGTNEMIASQVVDEDGDGAVDALIFLANIEPLRSAQYRIEPTSPALIPAARTYARHDAPRDDMAWENDRIAFRTFGKGLWAIEDLVSSGVDVWTKRTRDLVLDRWYAEVDGSYHEDWGQGADFYKVGPSLGTGGTALRFGDTLLRAPNFSSYRIVANGPIRTIFELEYEPWDAAGLNLSEKRRITIDAGQNFFHQETTFRTKEGDAVEVAVGVVKREGVTAAAQTEGPWAWLTVWGPVDRTVGGHGDLGSTIIVAADRFEEIAEEDQHHLVIAAARSGESIPHYIGTGWTASGDFADAEAWSNHVKAFIARLESPLRVTY